uniref:Uncharacterized protein n=1 Tax=Oryza glumipatula TaxID=40148 RepID=A0A0E0BRX2_9ORYZ
MTRCLRLRTVATRRRRPGAASARSSTLQGGDAGRGQWTMRRRRQLGVACCDEAAAKRRCRVGAVTAGNGVRRGRLVGTAH